MEPGNILHIESLDTGWRDKDSVLLHACFQLLKDCIENENLLDGSTDWDSDDKHKRAKIELNALYQWWMARAAAEFDEAVPIPEQYAEEDEMLIRLIRVRWALWT